MVTVAKQLHVTAAPADVWAVLVQPAAIVGCLPGATLVDSTEDGLRHTGTVSVNLGPLGVTYRGTAEFVEIDHTARRLRVTARGRESAGAGTVSMLVVADVAAAGSGAGSVIDLSASVQLTGRIVSLGRGVVDVVMEETLAAFSACLSQKLDAGDTGHVGAGGAGSGEATSGDAGRALDGEAASATSAFRVLLRACRTWIRRRLARG
jgi:uncharacterized protein